MKTLYECSNCGKSFEEIKTIFTTYENYYGISENFLNLTLLQLFVCPYCECDSIHEISINERVSDKDV